MPEIDVIISMDTYISEANPNTNYGTSDTLIVGERPLASGMNRFLLKFVLPAAPAPGSVLSGASLMLVKKSQQTCGPAPTKISVRRAHGFDELTTVWNNQPSQFEEIAYMIWVPPNGQNWMDISTYILENFDWGDTVFLGVMMEPEEGYCGKARFESKETTSNPWKRPTMRLFYDDQPPDPSTVSLAPQALDKEKNTVNWTQNLNNDFQKYEIYRRVNGGSFVLVNTVLVQATVTWDDPLVLVDGDTYEYLVTTYDLGANQTDSNIAGMVKPKIVAASITNTQIKINQGTQVTLITKDPCVLFYYDWDDGTPYWAGSEIDVHIYTSAAVYNPEFQVEDAGGWRSNIHNTSVITVVSEAPLAKIHVYPLVVDVDEPVTIDGSESHDQDITGYIDEYEFDIGAGFVSNGKNAILVTSFPMYGSFPVSLRVTDNDLDQAIATGIVTVLAPNIQPLMLNFMPTKNKRARTANLDEDPGFTKNETWAERTSVTELKIDVGAKCQGDLGEADINMLEDIRDSSDGSKWVTIIIEGKTYTGRLSNIQISPIVPAPSKSWRWDARLSVPVPPGD